MKKRCRAKSPKSSIDLSEMSGRGVKLIKTQITPLLKSTLDWALNAISKSSAMKPFISRFLSSSGTKGKRK